MLFDLFSSLDFSIYNKKILKKLIWLIRVLWLIYLFNFFFFNKIFFSLIKKLNFQFFNNVKIKILKKTKFRYLLVYNIFIFILIRKLWGLIPYVYGKTTQIVLSFRIRITIWLIIFLSKIIFKLKNFRAHLTPNNSPFFLIRILNKIELFRKLIRPITLSLRLRIKISTGHIFFILLCKGFIKILFNEKILFFLFFLIIFFYIFFEFGICILQSFVFSLLCIQYMDEHKIV